MSLYCSESSVPAQPAREQRHFKSDLHYDGADTEQATAKCMADACWSHQGEEQRRGAEVKWARPPKERT